jgi:hypothetical protein
MNPAVGTSEPQAATPVSRSQGPGGVVRVRQPEQTQVLYQEIVSPERVYPVVGLSCKFGRAESPISLERVREVVWDTAASRLHYWQRPDGLVELAAVGVHDAIGPLV